jgi:hypothetical protein
MAEDGRRVGHGRPGYKLRESYAHEFSDINLEINEPTCTIEVRLDAVEVNCAV